jgi:hypothetical protein
MCKIMLCVYSIVHNIYKYKKLYYIHISEIKNKLKVF